MPRRPRRRQLGTHRLVLASPATSATERHRDRRRRRAVRTVGVFVLLLGLLWTLPLGAQAVGL